MAMLQSFRAEFGWSREKLAHESGVQVSSVYLLERLGTAGPEDDAKVFNTLARCHLDRLRLSRLERVSVCHDDAGPGLVSFTGDEMATALAPLDEIARLAVLQGYGVLDSPPDPRADVFVKLAADLYDAPISLVSLVDKDRQWFKAATGLDATETPRGLSFCAHAILNPSEVMVVEDATLDPRFKDNALVVGKPGIRFYAGAPILSPNGYPLGTLCVIDDKPRQLDQAGRKRLQNLAAGVASVLDLHQSTNRLSATHDLLTDFANRAVIASSRSAE